MMVTTAWCGNCAGHWDCTNIAPPIRAAGTIEIRLWILSWGEEVEVLEPAALRDDVAATLARAAARYAAGTR